MGITMFLWSFREKKTAQKVKTGDGLPLHSYLHSIIFIFSCTFWKPTCYSSARYHMDSIPEWDKNFHVGRISN